MDRVEKENVSEVEKSRLMHQGYVAGWFAAHREEATAALAAEKRQKTFNSVCGEKSIALAEARIDPLAL